MLEKLDPIGTERQDVRSSQRGRMGIQCRWNGDIINQLIFGYIWVFLKMEQQTRNPKQFSREHGGKNHGSLKFFKISNQSFEKSLEVTTRRPGEAEDVNSLQVESLEEQQLQLLQARDKAASSRELGDNETSSSWNLHELKQLKWQGPNCNPWKTLWDLWDLPNQLELLKLGGMSGNHMAQNTTKQNTAEFP